MIAPIGRIMAEREKEPKDKAVKIDRAVAERAAIVAKSKGMTLTEYLTSLIRPVVEREFPKAWERYQRRFEDVN